MKNMSEGLPPKKIKYLVEMQSLCKDCRFSCKAALVTIDEKKRLKTVPRLTICPTRSAAMRKIPKGLHPEPCQVCPLWALGGLRNEGCIEDGICYRRL